MAYCFPARRRTPSREDQVSWRGSFAAGRIAQVGPWGIEPQPAAYKAAALTTVLRARIGSEEVGCPRKESNLHGWFRRPAAHPRAGTWRRVEELNLTLSRPLFSKQVRSRTVLLSVEEGGGIEPLAPFGARTAFETVATPRGFTFHARVTPFREGCPATGFGPATEGPYRTRPSRSKRTRPARPLGS